MTSAFGSSGFPVEVGRAGVLAAPALGAGEPVEDVLPAEVGEGPQAVRRVVRLEVHRREGAARLELAEVDVEEARDDVEVLRQREPDEEGADEGDVGPPVDREERLEDGRVDAGELGPDRVRDDRPRQRAVQGAAS